MPELKKQAAIDKDKSALNSNMPVTCTAHISQKTVALMRCAAEVWGASESGKAFQGSAQAQVVLHLRLQACAGFQGKSIAMAVESRVIEALRDQGYALISDHDARSHRSPPVAQHAL